MVRVQISSSIGGYKSFYLDNVSDDKKRVYLTANTANSYGRTSTTVQNKELAYQVIIDGIHKLLKDEE